VINFKPVTELSDFQALKKGDTVAVEWHRDSYKRQKRVRFATYDVVDNIENMTEIILQKEKNVYFNYAMFLNPEKHGHSNLKSIMLITSDGV